MQGSVETYPRAAVERAMRVQEVILRAMAKKITWWQAAEIIGISDRQMRRWRERYEEHGYDGLMDRRRGLPSSKRVPLKQVEEVLGLYRERYFDLNVRHFHEKLGEEHGIELSYTWVKQALQGAGLVAKARQRGVHRRRRERRPVPGMLLHIDGSRHQWFQDERWYDLIVILDDFLIGAPVKQARVASLAALAASRQLPYLRLVPLGRSLLERLSGGRESQAQITRIRANHPFYAALQIAIWRKDHLLAMLAKGCTIWEFEHEKITGRVHHAIVADPPIIYRHVVEKGRWLPDARLVFERAGLVFRTGNRAVWSRWRYLRLMSDRIRWLLLGYSTC